MAPVGVGLNGMAMGAMNTKGRRAGPLAMGLLVLLPVMAGAGAGGLTGQPAPDFALKDTAGNNLRLSEYRGQVVLLAFWAEWCGRCILQLDAMADLQERYSGAGLQVLAVNIDTTDAAARTAAARLGLPVLRDQARAVARQYDLDDLPVALLVDAHGRIRHVYEKYRDGDEARYEAELQALLRE